MSVREKVLHGLTRSDSVRVVAGFGYVTERLAPVHPHYSDYRQEYLWAVARG